MMKAKHARRMAAGMACILLCGGCAGKKEEADVYIDENEPDVVISLFTQIIMRRKACLTGNFC